MPQLNPTPWFSFLALAWLVLLVILPVKILSHTFPNAIALLVAGKLNMNTWNWPWH
uniref:ATP synthase complex subunit 8 n=1 Tax=Callanthias japonicus TaxID=270594 RepID=A0A1V1FRB8_9TELE|nr:ATPase subunit 8 [Callanthias japonicus]BBU25856.1 ATPase subunit 8 [Callanthias japonicus]